MEAPMMPMPPKRTAMISSLYFIGNGKVCFLSDMDVLLCIIHFNIDPSCARRTRCPVDAYEQRETVEGIRLQVDRRGDRLDHARVEAFHGHQQVDGPRQFVFHRKHVSIDDPAVLSYYRQNVMGQNDH